MMKKLLLTFCTLIFTCGVAQATPSPVTCGTKTIDLVIMMDRTGSVSTTARAAEAAAAKSLLDTFISLNAGHKVAIGAFNNDVAGGAEAQIIATLSTDYAALKTAVTNAMNHQSGGTNIEAAVTVAQNELQTNGTSAIKVIVLISDGETVRKTTNQTCDAALNFSSYECSAYKAAEAAKTAGTRIITVSYDSSSSSSTDVNGRKLLAAMANQPSDDDSVGDVSGAEQTAENTDGDDFFISPTDNSLTAIFSQIGGTILCDDGDACTLDVCSQNNQCVYNPIDTDNDGNADCSDGCPLDPVKNSPGQCGCGQADTDTDGDGTADCNDLCPGDAAKTSPGVCGCGSSDVNSDGDGKVDCQDGCPQDPAKIIPGACGCGVADTDTDGDGSANCNDGCPSDAGKTAPGVCGCGTADVDTDGDQALNCNDNCPSDPAKVNPGQCGCGVVDTDTDGDGVANCNDSCPQDASKTAPGVCGCGVADADTDSDGTLNCNDLCPSDAGKTAPGTCGCGVADTDTDGDGNPNCNDGCPGDAAKTAPGQCGCGVADTDTDGDGTADCNDQCLSDTTKTQPGICGCGVADVDTDSDGTLNCNDQCPNDAGKTAPGQCGCGIADTDTDGDYTANCNDNCPEDAGKIAAGICGCGVADVDTDSDGVANCNDQCPEDNNKTQPGQCGCGIADTDSDQDGYADCTDLCPGDSAKTSPGICGCNAAEVDTDSDGTLNCMDGCPDDTGKIYEGICGCGIPDIDSDNDGAADCVDSCPENPGKVVPGQCGCGEADTDSDEDGIANCNDNCPTDPSKVAAGICGCNVSDADTDEDGSANCNDLCPGDVNKVAPGQCGCGEADVDTDQDGQANCSDLCPNDVSKTAPGQCGCGVGDADADNDSVANCNDQCPDDASKTIPGTCGCGAADTDSNNNGVADCNDVINNENPPVETPATPETPDDEGTDIQPTPQIAPGAGNGVAGGRGCNLTTGIAMTSGFPLVTGLFLGLLGMIMLIRFGNKKNVKLILLLALFLAPFMGARSALALNVQKLRPSNGHTSGYVVHTSETLPQGKFSFGINMNLASNPLYGTPGGTSLRAHVVNHFVTADILAGYGFTDWFNVNVDMPVNVHRSIDPTFIATKDTGWFDAGDLQLSAKFRLYDASKTSTHLGLALVPFVSLPTGRDSVYLGDNSITGGVTAAGDWLYRDNRFYVNLGTRLKKSETLTNLTVKNEMLYGVGFERPIVKDWNLDVIAEAFGSTTFSKFATEDISSPLEAELTLRKKWLANKNLVTQIGGGVGITNGYGLPDYRLNAGISYALDFKKKTKKEVINLSVDIKFNTDKAVIKSVSFPELDHVVQVMKTHPEITNVTIEGHTDSTASDSYNMGLSQRRANSVKTYLVGHGIEASRLTAIGYGESKPVADNNTEAGRSQNRRTVFSISKIVK